jgi:hypothetical protein
MISRGQRYLIAWRGGILLRGVGGGSCGGEAGDVELRDHGCAVLGAGGGVGGGVGFVGDDSVIGGGLLSGKNKRGSIEFYDRASWGAPFEAQGKAVLRPYTEGGADQATVIGSALRDE